MDTELADLIGRQIDGDAVAVSGIVAARSIMRTGVAGAECRSAAQIGKVGSEHRQRVDQTRARRNLQPLDRRDEMTQRIALQLVPPPNRDLKPDTAAVRFGTLPRQESLGH